MRAPTRMTRLRRSADVQAVLRVRAVSASPRAIVHALARDDTAAARWTVVAGKRNGSAVVRNRVKRRLRAAARAAALPTGVDLVIVARADAAHAAFSELTRELQATAAKAATRAGRRVR